MFDAADPGPDYELAWPREVFRAEAAAVLQLHGTPWTDDAELLLEEAFASSVPKDDLRGASREDLPSGLVDGPWSASSNQVSRGFLAKLANCSDALIERSGHRP
jgi:hypothetical protein